jgi:histidinol-phosphate aminotransferase
MPISRFVLPAVARAEPYAPILPLDVLAAELGMREADLVKLDANENPYGPSPAALAALRAYGDYHIYPDPGHEALRTELADHLGVPRETIVVGNGADELIDLLYRALAGPGDGVIDCVPTFGMYRFGAGLMDARYVAVPRRADFSVDVDAVLAAVDARTKLIWLTSPNNPTGNLLPEADARRILQAGVPTVIDEAYAEFAGVSLTPLAAEFDNLVLLRTFSKWAGLAGLRVGYGVFPEELADLLHRIKPPYNVNSAGMAAARAALADGEHRARTVAAIVAERERMAGLLARIGFLAPQPSCANFVFCWVRGREAAGVRAALREKGILVRHYGTPELRNGIRISVGRPEQTDRLIATLRALEA